MQSTDINTKIFEIISNIPDGQFIFVENVASGISNWSREAVEYFGLPGINVFNTKEVMRAMVHPDDVERWDQEMEAVFSLQRDGFFYTYQIRNAKGEYVPRIFSY